MKPSTRFLCEQFRLPTILSAVAISGIMGLCGLIGPWSDVNPWIAACLSFIGVILIRPHVRLLRLALFFPVEDHQAGFIPLAMTGGLWFIGLAALLPGQFLQAALHREWRDFLSFWIAALPLLPFYALILLAMIHHARGSQGEVNNPMSGILAFFVSMFIFSPTLERWVCVFWPLTLAGCWVMVQAAPPAWSAIRRQVIKWDQGCASSAVTVEPGGRKLATPFTDLADMIRNGLIILILVQILPLSSIMRMVPHVLSLRFLEGFLSDPANLVYLLFLSIPLAMIKYLLRCLLEARASGLNGKQAILVAFLKSTFVLEPLARRMGLQRGALILCGECGRHKFAWQTHCPHCQRQTESIQPDRKFVSNPTSWDMTLEEVEDPAATLYRMVIPGLLILCVFMRLISK